MCRICCPHQRAGARKDVPDDRPSAPAVRRPAGHDDRPDQCDSTTRRACHVQRRAHFRRSTTTVPQQPRAALRRRRVGQARSRQASDEAAPTSASVRTQVQGMFGDRVLLTASAGHCDARGHEAMPGSDARRRPGRKAGQQTSAGRSASSAGAGARPQRSLASSRLTVRSVGPRLWDGPVRGRPSRRAVLGTACRRDPSDARPGASLAKVDAWGPGYPALLGGVGRWRRPRLRRRRCAGCSRRGAARSACRLHGVVRRE